MILTRSMVSTCDVDVDMVIMGNRHITTSIQGRTLGDELPTAKVILLGVSGLPFLFSPFQIIFPL